MSLNIGMIGLDTSHAEIFTRLLHNNKSDFGNATVTIACPCPSEDLELSISRVHKYTEILKGNYNVMIIDSIEEVAEKADAVMINAVDGRKHKEFFKKVAPFRKPTFIDKPLALSESDARDIFTLGEYYHTPVMSSSSLRYADSLQKQLAQQTELPTGVYLNGPLPFIEKKPYYFWYGIHMIEMAFTVFGPNYKHIHVQGNKNYDVISAEWNDGRFGIIRGDHNWHGNFEAILHYTDETVHLPIYKDEKSYYACLLEQIITFFKTGINPIAEHETLGIIRFIEKANKLREEV